MCIDKKIAIPNIFGQEVKRLKAFAIEHKFTGIDWTLDPNLPEHQFYEFMDQLKYFEVRFHGKLQGIDLAYGGARGDTCYETYIRYVDLIHNVGGRFLTIHLGLGVESYSQLSLEKSKYYIKKLVEYAAKKRVQICLENLAKGWTSDPNTFVDIILDTGSYVTYDIGHAKTKIYPSDNGFLFYSRFVEGVEKRVKNAHIYDFEIPKKGHIPPISLKQLKSRLDILSKTSCDFWVIELFSARELSRVKKMISTYIN